jgi:hypothetical protein
MPFGLTNVGSTFQCAMDYAFRDLVGKIIEIYQDDLTVHFQEENSTHSPSIGQYLRDVESMVSLSTPRNQFLG